MLNAIINAVIGTLMVANIVTTTVNQNHVKVAAMNVSNIVTDLMIEKEEIEKEEVKKNNHVFATIYSIDGEMFVTLSVRGLTNKVTIKAMHVDVHFDGELYLVDITNVAGREFTIEAGECQLI